MTNQSKVPKERKGPTELLEGASYLEGIVLEKENGPPSPPHLQNWPKLKYIYILIRKRYKNNSLTKVGPKFTQVAGSISSNNTTL